MMEDLAAQQLQGKPWQPLRLLQRFRARVTALASWDSRLPVERDLEQEATPAPASPYACDVAVVCADATPAALLLRQRLERANHAERQALNEVYQRLQNSYSASGVPPQGHAVRRVAREAAAARDLLPEVGREMESFLVGPLQNALAQEQVFHWLAETDLKVHLYGRGFEDHPHLMRFAHYFTQSPDELRTIHRDAKMLLRLTCTPVTETYLAQGIRNGAFHLMRFFPEDVIDRIYRPLHAFCEAREIRDDEQLQKEADELTQRLLHFAKRTLGVSVFEVYEDFVEELRERNQGGFHQWPGGLWDEYDAVTFSSKDELLELIKLYLENGMDRRRIAGAMRRAFVEKIEGSAKASLAEAREVTGARAAGEVAA
jgi:hypothetical protein